MTDELITAAAAGLVILLASVAGYALVNYNIMLLKQIVTRNVIRYTAPHDKGLQA